MESSVISRAMAKSNMEGSQPGVDLCPRCGRDISGPNMLAHAKAEEYLIGLIGQDHPEWIGSDGACIRCVGYYQSLVELTGI